MSDVSPKASVDKAALLARMKKSKDAAASSKFAQVAVPSPRAEPPHMDFAFQTPAHSRPSNLAVEVPAQYGTPLHQQYAAPSPSPSQYAPSLAASAAAATSARKAKGRSVKWEDHMENFITKCLNQSSLSALWDRVDAVKLNLPTYYQIVTNPIALRDIKNRLVAKSYDSLEAFKADCDLLIKNVYAFNGTDPANWVVAIAHEFLKELNVCLSKLREKEEALLRKQQEAQAVINMPRASRTQIQAAMAPPAPSPRTPRNPTPSAPAPSSARSTPSAPAPSYLIPSAATLEQQRHIAMMEAEQEMLAQYGSSTPSYSSPRPPPSSAASKKQQSTPLAPVAAIPLPPQPMAGVREMSFAEKRKLSTNINKLPGDRLAGVVEIIQLGAPRAKNQNDASDEIEIDLDKMDARTLRDLEKYVLECLSQSSKKGRTAPPPTKRKQEAPAASSKSKRGGGAKRGGRGGSAAASHAHAQPAMPMPSGDVDMMKDEEEGGLEIAEDEHHHHQQPHAAASSSSAVKQEQQQPKPDFFGSESSAEESESESDSDDDDDDDLGFSSSKSKRQRIQPPQHSSSASSSKSPTLASSSSSFVVPPPLPPQPSISPPIDSKLLFSVDQSDFSSPSGDDMHLGGGLLQSSSSEFDMIPHPSSTAPKAPVTLKNVESWSLLGSTPSPGAASAQQQQHQHHGNGSDWNSNVQAMLESKKRTEREREEHEERLRREREARDEELKAELERKRRQAEEDDRNRAEELRRQREAEREAERLKRESMQKTSTLTHDHMFQSFSQ